MAEQNEGLRSIKVSGFKSAIAPVEVRIADLTILAGQNSAGKSTVMQPLLMIKQTIEKPFDPGGLAIDGPLVRFTSVDQFLSRQAGHARALGYQLQLGYPDYKFTLHYTRSEETGIDLRSMSVVESDKEYTWRLGQSLELSDPSLPETMKQFIRRGHKAVITRDRATLVLGMTLEPTRTINRNRVVTFGPNPAQVIVQDARNFIHLPGLRGNPERSYAISVGGPRYPGSFNDYVASIIHHWKSKKDDKLAALGAHLRKLGLTWRVTAERIDDTRVEIKVGRLPAAIRGGARDTVNIADVGFGVSQTLPVLVALLAATKGQIVFIEQPELHLHPKAQVALASLLAEAANRGVRLIVETHSSLLLLALQTTIASGELDPQRVSMNWFTRDNAGQTHVAEAQIGPDGSYGDWPVDFDSIELRLQDEYLTLAEARHG